MSNVILSIPQDRKEFQNCAQFERAITNFYRAFVELVAAYLICRSTISNAIPAGTNNTTLGNLGCGGPRLFLNVEIAKPDYRQCWRLH